MTRNTIKDTTLNYSYHIDDKEYIILSHRKYKDFDSYDIGKQMLKKLRKNDF